MSASIEPSVPSDAEKESASGDGAAPDDGAPGDESEPTTPKPVPMAFTVDFGDAKQVDMSRLEELAKKSQARHQRVQSMSASVTRPAPVAPKPPLSVNLPRKAQGYNSEGYFSSDQEESIISGSIKLKNNPLAQIMAMSSPLSKLDFQPRRPSKSPIVESIKPHRSSNSPIVESIKPHRSSNSPIVDSVQPRRSSNSPIVDSVQPRRMSKSPIVDSVQPRRMSKSPIVDSAQPRRMSKSPIVDSIMSKSDSFTRYASRQGLNLPLKHSNGSYLRDVHRSPSYSNLDYQVRHMEDIIDNSPDEVMLSDISSPELDILTPDNGLSTPGCRSLLNEHIGSETFELMHQQTLAEDDDRQSTSSTGTYTIEKHNCAEQACKPTQDPQLTFGFPDNTPSRDHRRALHARSALTLNTTYDLPSDLYNKTCDNPVEQNNTNILEMSCSYESPTENDLAAQTSKQIKSTRNYLEKIKSRVRTITEKTFSKGQGLPPLEDVGSFTSVTTSGVLSARGRVGCVSPPQPRRRCSLAQSDIDRTDYVHRLTRETSVPVCLTDDPAPAPLVGQLSHMSLNRCKGDNTWIQDWAESVKKYNSNALDITYSVDDRPPAAPRLIATTRTRTPVEGSPCKIPSPVGTLRLLHRKTPDVIPSHETEAYLLRTQNAITNLQANVQERRAAAATPPPATPPPPQASRLPVAQLSRSNSLNYRLRRKESDSPLRTPGSYVITGSGRQLASPSPGVAPRDCNWNVSATRAPPPPPPRIEQTRRLETGRRALPRSSSCHVVNNNNLFLTPPARTNYLSDDSDTENEPGDRYKRFHRGRIDSPNWKNVPANSPRCPGTPELPRKFGSARGSVRTPVREPSRAARTPASEPARAKRGPAPVFNKQAEFSNWKRRASYDPMKAAQEGRKKQLTAKTHEKDDLSSPSHSSGVVRSQSQSFHTALGELTLQYSSEDDELYVTATDANNMSTHSDILHSRPRPRGAQQVTSVPRRVPPHVLPSRAAANAHDDRRLIVDSDTNSTASPRNSSIFSQEKVSLTTCTSDTEGDSGGEGARGGPPHAPGRRAASAPTHNRHSVMPSEMPSVRRAAPGPVQPRYLDISRHRATPRDAARRDTTSTPRLTKGSAAHIEMEQKKQELAKWRRRASYDPRAAARAHKLPPYNYIAESGGSVLRSQSFHGPLVAHVDTPRPPVPVTRSDTARARAAHPYAFDEGSDF